MPSSKNARTPSYRLYKRTGQAVVTLNGKDIYLGKYGSRASREAYNRLIAEWFANDRCIPAADPDSEGMTVVELLAAYLRYAKGYYTPDGYPSGELGKIRLSLRPVAKLYGQSKATAFGPLALKAVRQVFVDAGNGRRYIHDQVARIKRMFRWGVENEFIPPNVFHGLQAVAGLRRGRCSAPEPKPVKPVPDEHVNAIRLHVSAPVWAMVQLQRCTGMRPGEVTIMRRCDIDTSGLIWLYHPASHKTQRFGHERTVEIGPRAQEVIRPFLKSDLEAYLFSPISVVAEHRAVRRRQRNTPITPTPNDTKPGVFPHCIVAPPGWTVARVTES